MDSLEQPLQTSASQDAIPGFSQASKQELEAHLEVRHYDGFTLTDAIRPAIDLKVIPRQGYRRDCYRNEKEGRNVPVLMCAASQEILFELFMELIENFGQEVDVVLETSHYQDQAGHLDSYREQIEAPILQSILWGHEERLLNDGCTGIAVMNPRTPQEIQFDEHKMLVVYGEPLAPFEEILRAHDVQLDQEIRFLTEAEHVHSSNESYYDEFEELRMHLGMDSGDMLNAC